MKKAKQKEVRLLQKRYEKGKTNKETNKKTKK